MKLLFPPKLKFEPKDLWIGCYWHKTGSILSVYVCVVPMLPIVSHWKLNPRKVDRIEMSYTEIDAHNHSQPQ